MSSLEHKCCQRSLNQVLFATFVKVFSKTPLRPKNIRVLKCPEKIDCQSRIFFKCDVFSSFQKATEKVRKEEKEELYRKLLDTYEARKKMGLSSDLTRKLRRRRKLRRMRHHRKSKREFIFSKLQKHLMWLRKTQF